MQKIPKNGHGDVLRMGKCLRISVYKRQKFEKNFPGSRKNCVIFDDNFGLPFKYWSELLGMRLELYKPTEWVIFNMSTSSKCALCCKTIYS